jgi:PEP-CTERM motif
MSTEHVHGVINVDFTSPTLPAGANSIEVFYDDRQHTGASLSLNLITEGVVITPGVPEPSTWAMMLLGFSTLGLAAYRKTRTALST